MIGEKHITELNRIIDSILENKDETASFTSYIEELCNVADQSFTSKKWPLKWRRTVYKFGRVFIEKDAGPYLVLLDKFLTEDKLCEVAAFIYSEIIWNYFEDRSEYNKRILKRYIKKFPHNPEFHNSYGISLASNYVFENALSAHKLAIKIDGENILYVSNYTHAVKQYFEYLLEKNNLKKAEEIINSAIDFVDNLGLDGIKKWEQMGKLRSLRDRQNDFQIIFENVELFRGDIEAKIRGEQKKLIEILGIFSAILAFILTNINIALKSLNTSEMLSLMFGMALVLMIFALSISILFSPRKKYAHQFIQFRDSRVLMIFALVIILLSWIYFVHQIYGDEKSVNKNDLESEVSVTGVQI